MHTQQPQALSFSPKEQAHHSVGKKEMQNRHPHNAGGAAELQACRFPGRLTPCRPWGGQYWGMTPRLLRSVLWWDAQGGWEFHIRLREALCLVSRTCNDCCSSRCCGLQGLGIPRVRNVGLGLEFWNLIWENLSSRQKCTMTWPAHLSSSGFECTGKGLMWKENTTCQRISGPARARHKHGPKHRSELSLLKFIWRFPGLALFCTWCSSAQCFEMWSNLKSTIAFLS